MKKKSIDVYERNSRGRGEGIKQGGVDRPRGYNLKVNGKITFSSTDAEGKTKGSDEKMK